MVSLKVKVLDIAIFCFVAILGLCVWILLGSSSNDKLMRNEIKAYFRPTIYLDYHPNVDEINMIQMGGTISMPSCDLRKYDGVALYNTKQHMEQITNYLNAIPLVWAAEDELPNLSPDAFIQYFDDRGDLVQNFTIYGQVFIRDVNQKKLYRIKKSSTGIITGLEKLEFE